MADQANMDYGSANAHMLVRALEDMILPIIHTHIPGLAANRSTIDEDGARLEPEAQHLIAAFKAFIDALVRPRRFQLEQGDIDSKQSAEDSQEVINLAPVLDHNLSIAQSSRNEVNVQSEQPWLLKSALQEVRHHVFNNMPIRLLAFKSDGSDIELVERSTISDRISVVMESGIDEANHISEIYDLAVTPSNTSNPTVVERKAIEDFISRYANYAILSHTWLHDLPGEVTYAAWKAGDFDKNSPGYQKLANFCRVAATEYGVTFGWMDTICINKESSAELDESICSMYKWYRDASICVTYLAQTMALERMRHDSWFTRGWTLQELLAPESVEFYGTNWQKIAPDLSHNTRNRLIQVEIQAATTITQNDRAVFKDDRHEIPISRKMEWAANRHVTREEDAAYSLMGIFDVSLPIAYGEGSERAFIRLLKEILNLTSGSVLDILNWGSGPTGEGEHPSAISSLLPSSPKQFLWHSDTYVTWPSLSVPTTLTNLGLNVSILLMPAIEVDPIWPNASWAPIGQYYATADIDLLGLPEARNPGIPMSMRFNLLDRVINNPRPGPAWTYRDPNPRLRIIFGILNFKETENSVYIPRIPCFAICLSSGGDFLSAGTAIPEFGYVRKISTSRAVVVDIHRVLGYSAESVSKSELRNHGMQLLNMHL